MGFPSKLKDVNFYVDGTGFIGEIDELGLPKIAIKTDSYRAGLGEVDIDQGLDKIELDVIMGGLIADIIAGFGSTISDGVLTRFAGAYQDDQTGEVRAMEIACRGKWKEMDFGNAKRGGETAHKYKLGCSYYEMTVDGLQWMEIDLINRVFVVMGVDRYAEIRAAIGA